jgi:hypothetical protein
MPFSNQFDLVVIWFDRGVFGALFYFYLTAGRHKITAALAMMER